MEHGIITSTSLEQGVVICNVQPVRLNTEYPNVPMLKPFPALTVVPTIGQRVAMTELSDGTRFITGIIGRTPEGSQPTGLVGGDVCIQLDPTTKLKFTKNDAGDYDITLSASGDVTIETANHLQLTGSTIDLDTSGA